MYSEQQIIGLRAGKKLGEKLRLALDKYTLVTHLDMSRLPENTHWHTAALDQHLFVDVWLKREHDRQKNKLDSQRAAVDRIAAAGIVLKLTNLASKEAYTGTFTAVRLGSASLILANEGKPDTTVVFGQSLPIPQEVVQSHYGTELTQSFEVMGVRPGSEWVLK
jgi:hypothetical protein